MGKVVSIHLAEKNRAAMKEVTTANLVADKGIEGDRYFGKKSRQNVTLVQLEFLEEAADELGVSYRAGMSRRNITVQGVPVNELIGKRFRIGEAELEGVSLCEPCWNMEASIGAGAVIALQGRCGIRARVVHGGIVQKGDEVRWIL